MSKIDKQALRADAVRAGGGKWIYIRTLSLSKAYITEETGATVINCTDGDVPAKCAGFLTSANPATVLALLDELETKDNRINRLEAIIAVAEQRNALMREWKRALKVPCDLVDDQVPVVIYGMVIRLDRLKETEAKLGAAEKRIAELEAKLETADKLQDSAFRHGLQHGFSFGQTDNQAGFEECLSAYGTRSKDNG